MDKEQLKQALLESLHVDVIVRTEIDYGQESKCVEVTIYFDGDIISQSEDTIYPVK